jgi:predicted phosphodiesterase
MMKLALLSDIHGNSVALDAVLEDVAALGGVDAYWVLGDLVALGPDPVGVLERLAALPEAHCIRGNTDRYVTTGARPKPTLADVQARPELLPTLVEIAHTFAWTQGAVTEGGWFEWLDVLPLELRMALPDGTRLLGVHASPGRDDGDGILPTCTEQELAALLTGCEAQLIAVGHTHRPLDRRANGQRAVNLGSLSNHLTADLRASYVLLEADRSGYQVTHRQVAYDREAVIAALQRIRHPGAAYIIRNLGG